MDVSNAWCTSTSTRGISIKCTKVPAKWSVLANQMSAITYQPVRVEPGPTFTRRMLRKIFDQCSFCISKKSLIGSLLPLRRTRFFGSFRLGCRRTALSLGLSLTRRPECLTQRLAFIQVPFFVNMTDQVVSQQLHDECGILVALFTQCVELGNSIIKSLFCEVASLIRRVEDLVVEDGEVQRETKTDWVSWREISAGNFGGVLVGF